MKQCSICKEWKPLDEFYRDINKKYGRQSACKECSKISKQIYYKKNKNKLKSASLTRKNNNHSKYWAKGVIASHKTNGVIISVSEDFIKNILEKTDYCPICGCKLKKEYGTDSDLCNASLDRINNENEIREDNVQIICRRCNTTKLDRSMEEMYEYCKRFIEFYEISEIK